MPPVLLFIHQKQKSILINFNQKSILINLKINFENLKISFISKGLLLFFHNKICSGNWLPSQFFALLSQLTEPRLFAMQRNASKNMGIAKTSKMDAPLDHLLVAFAPNNHGTSSEFALFS